MTGCAHFPGGVGLLVKANIENAPVQLGPAALSGDARDGKRIRALLQAHSRNEKRKRTRSILRCGSLDGLCPNLFSEGVQQGKGKGSPGPCVGNEPSALSLLIPGMGLQQGSYTLTI